MFKTAVVAAAFVASATAETFYWNKNNNFETASNWDIAPVVSANGKSVKFPGSVKIPDASDCSIGNNWASKVGRVMKVATDIEMSTLTLPTNGKIILGDDITMTISEAKTSDTETAWACKPAHATNFKCGDNWNVGGFDEAEPAHMVPCIDDTIVFPDDSKAIQVHIPIATFVSEVQVANPSGKTATFVGDTLTSDGAFNNQDDVKVYTDGTEGQFLGSMILTDKKGFPVGFEKASCTNDCGKHFAGKTANATVKICPGDPMGETTCSESEKVTITDDEWQRQMMFKAVEAQLAVANKHADKMKGFADIGKMVNNKVDKVKSKLLSLPYPMGRVTAGNVALPSVAFKNGTAAPYNSNDWGEALTTLLEGVLDGESAKGIKNVVCQPAGKGGKLSCSGFAGIKLPQGKQAALLASMAKAIEVFFAQMDFDTVPLVIPKISTKEQNVEETIAFSFKDGNFGMSPFGGANFLKANEAEHIEASLTIGEATKIFDNYDASPQEDKTKFIEYISAMVEATSSSPLEVNGLNFGTPPIQVDKSGRRVRRAKIAGHTFSPAQFRMDVKLMIKGGPLLFDPASVAGPMAVGLWGANSLFLKAASLNKLADAFSSTTTTTTRVTKAPGAVTIAEADKVKADEAVAKSFDELVTELPMLKGVLAVENKTVQKAAAALELAKQKKDVKCQDHTSSACKSAKESLNTAYATYDAAVADLAKTVQKLEVYQAEFDKKKVVDDAAKAAAAAERDDATNAKINAANAKASAAAGKVAAKKAEVEAKESAKKSAEENIERIKKEILEKKCAEKDTETLAECEELTKEKTKFEESLSAVLAELATLKAELKKAEAEKADADAAASKTNAEAEKKEAPTMGNSNSNMANSGDVQTAMQGAGSPASSDDGNPFAMLGQFGMKPADIGDYGAEFGDKCRGFNMFLKGEKMTQTCQGLDTESACTADKTCEWDSRDCGVSGQAAMDAMGLKIDQEAVTAEITAAGADMEKIKAVIKKNMAKLLPIMNDRNATMKTITEYNTKCQGKAKDACKGVDVCEVKLNSQYVGGGQYKMAEECEVDQDKAVKTLKCSGLTKMLADNDAMKTKNVAAKAKKTLESKKTKLAAATKAVEDYKKANPDAKAETDTQLKALVATQTTADASVKTASTQADTADTAAKAAEQKAADTADDSSALRALPSVMAVVAATVAAAFA